MPQCGAKRSHFYDYSGLKWLYNVSLWTEEINANVWNSVLSDLFCSKVDLDLNFGRKFSETLHYYYSTIVLFTIVLLYLSPQFPSINEFLTLNYQQNIKSNQNKQTADLKCKQIAENEGI